MREVTKTYLHLKVARAEAYEQMLEVVPQPPGCAPSTELHGGDQQIIRPEDHRLFVGTPGEVESKQAELIETENDNGDPIPDW